MQQQLQNLEPVAPWLWRIEIVHVVLKRGRQQKLTQAEGIQYLQAIEALNVEIVDEPSDRTMIELAHTARPYQLTCLMPNHYHLLLQKPQFQGTTPC